MISTIVVLALVLAVVLVVLAIVSRHATAVSSVSSVGSILASFAAALVYAGGEGDESAALLIAGLAVLAATALGMLAYMPRIVGAALRTRETYRH